MSANKITEVCPCKNCVEDRTSTCHSTCNRYIKWKKILDKANFRINEYYKVNTNYKHVIYKGKTKK